MGSIFKQSKTLLLLIFACTTGGSEASAQICPPNIDFENGSFSNWKAYRGGVSAATGSNVISLFETQPATGNLEIFSRASNATVTDYFGDFPVVCPNGSGYSVKLGNTTGGAEADGLSYEFTIPAGRNEYSLTYHYAVVFEGPNHQEYQQPRLEIEVMNVTDNQRIDCSSFTFIPFGSALPGFQLSSKQQNNNAVVWYKDWTPVTINLNNKAGKTIRIFFKSADCTFIRHFGYAYVDVNTECNGEFPGAAFCPNDALVKVTAPYGFESYKWFNQTFSQVLGTSNELTLAPAPSSGTLLAVEVTPYFGYGCKDTIYTRLIDTLKVQAYAGKDTSYCGVDPVIIGEPPKPGRIYSWSPATGLSDAFSSNPLATPGVTTTYTLTVSSNGGGCKATDQVVVKSLLPDSSLRFAGKTFFCSSSKDSAVVYSANGVITQWYKNGVAIPGAVQNRYQITSSGIYHAAVKNLTGCILSTRFVNVTIDEEEKAVKYPVRYTFAERVLNLNARQIGDTVLWRPPNELNDAKIYNPDFRSSELGNYYYTIRFASASGCVTVDSQLVKVIAKVEIFLPNAFTPNNDNLNDVFSPVLIGISEIQFFKIYNRLGGEVYSWSPERPAWDGKYKNILQHPDTYVWHFRGIGIDGQPYYRRGIVTLLR